MHPGLVAITQDSRPVAASGRFTVGDGPSVHRLGFGTMQLTGPGVWGPPADPDSAVAVLRRAAELGTELFDTADSYGPEVAENLLRTALHPYDGVTIATKAGLLRTGPGEWHPCGRPDYLRQQCELSLRRLGVDRIDLFQLHRLDPTVPADEQFGVLAALKAEGKIAEVGLSEVTVEQIEQAGSAVDIATVQNRYNLVDRASDDVLRHCTSHGIGFLPWFPIASGRLAEPGGPVAEIAERLGATAAQVALAWLLRRSSVMLPIPGTSSLDHLDENSRAAELVLDAESVEKLDAAA
ncbi:MAG: aldo/keto reductase [Pseudonocardia sp.]|nr:aldo/keto reductase [Pseudonocardia sp.]